MECSQLRERDYWVDLEFPGSGSRVSMPGHFFLSNETENLVKRSAPSIGQHNNEILGQELGLSIHEIIELKEAGVI
jgi:crotonobetainyl-CoA:carnitine CoA-transferase CaiB-like acyl-CoA transferase